VAHCVYNADTYATGSETVQSLVINRRKLRQLRMDLGWTQKDLERQSGVRRSTISKIETGELEITKKRFALFQEVINPLIRRETMNANEKGMKISVENRKGFERVEIEADPLLLDVVYTNLVSNALKYGREGGEISLGFKENEKGFTLSVRNEGEGIPQNKLEAVFEKFMRLDEKSPLRGSGLGLYNTREVIVRHGGKIWAESEQGKWVKFIFTLPKNQE